MDQNKVESSSSANSGSKEHASQLRRPTLTKIGSYTTPKTSQDSRPDSSSRSSTSSRDHGTILTADTEQFIIGQKVWVGGTSPGQIAYIGETHFAPGEWAGIVLDEPNGKNDGCVAGKRYFQCEAKKGIFSRLTRLTLQPLEGAVAKSGLKYSPDRSRTVSPTPSTQSVLNKSMGGRHGFKIGDRVIVSSGFGSRPGTLRFLGETQFSSGNWCGIELDDATGKNDGSVEGVKYFECKPKYGIFVPVAKVSLSPSSAKSRLSRAGSRESLASVGTMNSFATTNTSRLRMQRYSNSMKQPPPSASKSSFSMQDLLREKQNHIEQLMIERDMEQEDAQNQALQFQKIILELKSKIDSLEKKLDDEKNKTEDLQLSIEEANFCGDELNAQTQVYKEKISDLEQRLRAVTSGAENQLISDMPVITEVVSNTEITSSTETKKNIQQTNNQYSINQSEKSKLDNVNRTKALNAFRSLICMKDSKQFDTTYQGHLNLYIQNADEIRRAHSIETPLDQINDSFLKDLCESLALAIKEISSLSLESKNAMAKCQEIALKTNKDEAERLENEKIHILDKNLEDLTVNCNNLSGLNEQLKKENQMSKEKIEQFENEKQKMSLELQTITSNCQSLAGLNEQLQKELSLNQGKAKELEQEKQNILQKLENLQSNCRNFPGINAEMQSKAEEDNLNQYDKANRNLEDILHSCKRLSELNEKLTQDLKTNEDRLEEMKTAKREISQNLQETTSNCKRYTEIIEDLQQKLKTSEETSSQLQSKDLNASKNIEDITANCNSLSDQNKKLKEELTSIQERSTLLEAEKLTILQNLERSEGKLKEIEKEKSEISAELNDFKTRHDSLSKQIESISQDLRVSEGKSKLLETENLDISQKLEDVQSILKNTLEQNESLQQKLKTNEEKSNFHEAEKLSLLQKLEKSEEKLKEIEKEKSEISAELNDFKTRHDSLSKQIESISQDLRVSEGKSKLLETENLDISQKLEDVQSILKNTLEQNESLQQKLKTNEEKSNLHEAEKLSLLQKLDKSEEKLKDVEKEKFDISIQLNDFKTRHESLSKQTESLSQDLRISEEKSKLLETEKFDVTQKLEEVQSTWKKTLEQNENLQQQIKTNEENLNLLEKEKFELSRKFKENSTNSNILTEQNEKLQQDLKANEENLKILEATNLDISLKLKDAISNYESLSEIKNKLQEELLSKNEGNDTFCNDLLHQIEKLQLEAKSSEESNKKLECEKFDLSQKLEKITSNVTSLTESNENVLQELQATNKKYKLLETQNYDLSRKLEDDSNKYISLLKTKDELQAEMNSDKEKTKQLEENSFKISRELDEMSSKYKNTSEENVKLQQKLEALAESITEFEVQKFELTQKLEKLTSTCDELSERNTQLQQKFSEAEDKIRQLNEEKLNISRKFEEVHLKNENLSELSKKLEQKLSAIENNTKQLDLEKGDISGKLNSVTIQCKNLEELNKKLQQEFNTINEQFKGNEAEKSIISQKLIDITVSYTDLIELKDRLQKELEETENRNKDLATEKLDISANLVDATLQIANLSELSENMQKELKSTEEKCNIIEKENLELSQKNEKLLESNKNIQKDLADFEEKASILKAEHLDISGNLVDATLQCENLLQEKGILEQKLKETEEKLMSLTENCAKSSDELISAQSILEEKARILKAENLDISGILIDATLQCENLSQEKVILEQKLKEAQENINNITEKGAKTADELILAQSVIEEKARVLKAENLEISGNLIDATLQCENLSQEKRILEQQLKEAEEKITILTEKSAKTADELISVQVKSQIPKADIAQEFSPKNIPSIVALIQSVKSELETEYFREALTKNDNLKSFIQNISKIETDLNTNQTLSQDLANASFDSNTQEVLLLEKRKAHQNVHNEFITGRLHLGNQLQDIYQFLISIKSQMENLDYDIQKIPSQSKFRTEMLSAAEEKSCKLHFDFIDLAQRFEALVKINEKYPSLRSSISKFILDEAKQNIKKQKAYSEFDPSDQIELLQNIIISYKLVLKANDVEIASNLLAKSDLELLAPEKHSEQKRILKNLQNDLDNIRTFIDKLEELNFILKSLRYFQSKLSKYNAQVNEIFNYLKNDKDSLEDICKVTLMLRDAEKQLQTECSEVTKILVNSMESFETSRKTSDKSSKTEKNQFSGPTSHIDKSIVTINNVMHSNSELLNLLSEKIETIDENITKSSINPHQHLEGNTEVKLKSENMDGTAAQINFLHSIIADMQQKNDKLKDKIETLESFSVDSQKSNMYEIISKRKPAPRMFCDICDQFDLHETEDCPLQESDGGEASFQSVENDSETKVLSHSSPARKYCENCEAFGDHETEDCYAGLE